MCGWGLHTEPQPLQRVVSNVSPSERLWGAQTVPKKEVTELASAEDVADSLTAVMTLRPTKAPTGIWCPQTFY